MERRSEGAAGAALSSGSHRAMSKIQAKANAKTNRTLQRTGARLGNCTAKTSAVRPMSSGGPTFIIRSNSDPLGFPGFAHRGGFSGL